MRVHTISTAKGPASWLVMYGADADVLCDAASWLRSGDESWRMVALHVVKDVNNNSSSCTVSYDRCPVADVRWVSLCDGPTHIRILKHMSHLLMFEAAGTLLKGLDRSDSVCVVDVEDVNPTPAFLRNVFKSMILEFPTPRHVIAPQHSAAYGSRSHRRMSFIINASLDGDLKKVPANHDDIIVTLPTLAAGSIEGVVAWMDAVVQFHKRHGLGPGVAVDGITTLLAGAGPNWGLGTDAVKIEGCGDHCEVIVADSSAVSFSTVDDSNLICERILRAGRGLKNIHRTTCLVGTSNVLCPAAAAFPDRRRNNHRDGMPSFRHLSVNPSSTDALILGIPSFIRDAWRGVAVNVSAVNSRRASRSRHPLMHCPFQAHNLILAMVSSYLPNEVDLLLATVARVAKTASATLPCLSLVVFVRDVEMWRAMVERTVLESVVWIVSSDAYAVAAKCMDRGAAMCRDEVYATWLSEQLNSYDVAIPHLPQLTFDAIGFVMTIDSRDAFLQADPFDMMARHVKGTHNDNDDILIAFTEGTPVGWLNPASENAYAIHKEWLSDMYSPQFFEAVSVSSVLLNAPNASASVPLPTPILNSGFVGGTPRASLKYFSLIVAAADALESHSKRNDFIMVDQGIMFGVILVAFPLHFPTVCVQLAVSRLWPVVQHLYQRAADIHWRGDGKSLIVMQSMLEPSKELVDIGIVHQMDRFPKLQLTLYQQYRNTKLFRKQN